MRQGSCLSVLDGLLPAQGHSALGWQVARGQEVGAQGPHLAQALSYRGSILGDDLVPVNSALGKHKRQAMDLGLDQAHTWVGHGVHHLDLLSDPADYRRLLGWLGG